MFGQGFNSGFFGGPPCFTDTTDIFKDNSGVALYTLDYDASSAPDATNDYSGTPTNVDFGVGGKSLYGARFNGSSSTIQLSGGDMGLTFGSSASYSIALWFNTSTIGTWQRLFNACGAGGNLSNQIAVSLYQSKIYVYRRTGTSTSVVASYTSTLSSNTWYHAAFMVSGSTVILYLNGVVHTLTSSSTTVISSVSNIIFGSHGYTPYFKGSIDQVRIFSKSLSSDEVGKLYGNGAGEIACTYTPTTGTVNYPPGTTPVAYYKLDNSSEDYSTGGSDGSDTSIEYRFGRFGQAAVFNNDSAITTSFNIGRTNDFTISFWVKDISDSNYGSYAYKWVAGVYNNDYIPINYNKTTGKISLSVHDGTTALGDLETPALDDNWHHIVFTQDVNVETKLYLDGVLQTSETISHASMTQRRSVSGGTGFYFGQNPSNSSTDLRLKGSIDQVRIYSTALTSSQVTQLYNEKPEVDTSNFKAVVYEGNGGTQYISNVGMDLETNGGLVWIKSRTLAASHGLYDSVRGAGYWLRSDYTDAQQFQRSTGYLSSFDSNGFTLSEGSSTDPTYTASYETHQINQDYAAWCWKGGGLLNKSASFNGSSSKIVVPASASIAQQNNYTFSAWFKTDTLGVMQTIYAFNSPLTYQSAIFIHSGGTNNIRIFSTGSNYYSSNNIYTNNQWYHIAVTKSSTNGIVAYLNGVSIINESTATANNLQPAGGDNRIGAYKTSAESLWFNGSIDQVRVFNKAISASEVTTLYNETASTINTLQVLGDTSCVAAYPLGVGAGDIGNTYSGTPTNVTFNNPGHLTRNNSGTIESTVSANTDAGFSIVKYTGNNTDGATVGTGLTEACNIVIVKDLTSANYWCVGGSTVGNGENLYLNDIGQKLTRDRVKSVQTSTFTLGSHFEVNSSNNFIAYCWHSVAGYSKIGTYEGTNSTVTVSDVGFKPSFVMIKNIDDTADWVMLDNRRNTIDDRLNNWLRANSNVIETGAVATAYITVNDSGFIVANATSLGTNANGDTYIYMAFK